MDGGKEAEWYSLGPTDVRIVDDRTIHARVGEPVLAKLIELLERDSPQGH